MADSAATVAVRLEDVQKTYRTGEVDVHAVRGVSLEIARGEFVALMGSSGSGKSTLMNILGCLDRPTAGRYFLDGEDVSSLDGDQLADVRNRKLGFVFQSFNLLARTSALENVELPLLYGTARLSNAQLRERAERVLEAVGLQGRGEHHPSQLSGGQQQRVSIARALINGGAIILADGPTGALDSKGGNEVMAILERSNAEGHTIVLASHDSAIAAHAQRIVRIADGRIVSAVPQNRAAAVRPVLAGPPAVRASGEIVVSFLPEDLPSLAGAPGVELAEPETELSSLLRYGNQDFVVTAAGTGEDFPRVHDWPPQSGEFSFRLNT